MHPAFTPPVCETNFLPAVSYQTIQEKIKSLTASNLLTVMSASKGEYKKEFAWWKITPQGKARKKNSLKNYKDCIDHLNEKQPTETVQETLLTYLLLGGLTDRTSLKFHVVFVLLHVGATFFNKKQAKEAKRKPKITDYTIADGVAQARVNLFKINLINWCQQESNVKVEMADPKASSSSDALRDEPKSEESLIDERVGSLTHDRFEQILDWAEADYKQQDHKQTRGSHHFFSRSQWSTFFFRDSRGWLKMREKYTPQARLLAFFSEAEGKSNLKSLKFRVAAAFMYGSEKRRDVTWLIKCAQSDNKSAGALVFACLEGLKAHARRELLDNDSKQQIQRV